MWNTMKTMFFMTLLILLFMIMGKIIGGSQGMVLAFFIAIGMNFFSYWFSDKIVLSMYNAKPLSPDETPELYNIVEKLAQRFNIPVPKLYIIQNPTPNAFATGRNPANAAIAIHTGLLNILDLDEIEGVLAHEMAHIYDRDILISTIVATIAGAIMFIANIARWGLMFGFGTSDEDDRGNIFLELIFIIIAPIVATLIQFAISRSREYLADENGAKFSQKPLALANALRKISYGVEKLPSRNINPATAHMFIMNPLNGNTILNLFSTHPPVEKRIKRLTEMASQINLNN